MFTKRFLSLLMALLMLFTITAPTLTWAADEGDPEIQTIDDDPPTVEIKTYKLTFTVTPKKAKTTIQVYTWREDGNYADAEPQVYKDRLRLIPGNYHYVVTAEGYETVEDDFTMKEKAKNIKVRLKKAAAPVDPTPEPADPVEPTPEPADPYANHSREDDSQIVTVGIIDDELAQAGTAGWYAHWWMDGTDSAGDVALTHTYATVSHSLGASYWEGAEQVFFVTTASLPDNATHFRIRHNGTDYGDGTSLAANRTAYVFSNNATALAQYEADPIANSAPRIARVSFSAPADWASVSVYAWYRTTGGQGFAFTAFPGTAMTQGTGTVYSADIPATVYGVAFNDGSDAKQTVDITAGIRNGAFWVAGATDDQGRYTVTAPAATYFKNGVLTYTGDLAAAFTDADDKTTITLLNDVILSAALTVSSGRTLTLDLNGHTLDRGLKNGEAISNGCVIHIYGGDLTIDDSVGVGVITGGNTTSYGGGVYVNGSFTMSGGAIIGNASGNGYGGGVYISNGTFTMSGGAIRNNTAERGGGVFMNRGTFTMKGGDIENNTASGNGGGVYQAGNGTFTMSGGAIENNTASDDGGGVYQAGNGTFTMSGGKITGNTAAGYGGGVYVNRTFNVSGSPVVTGNTSDNVYLPAEKTITVTDQLTNAASIGVTVLQSGPFTQGLNGKGTTANFVNDNATYYVLGEDGGEATLTSTHVHDGVTFDPWFETDSLPRASGSYYLTEDVTLSYYWHVGENMRLCLNGKTVSIAPDEGEVIYITNNAELNLYDCESGGKITGGSNGGVYVGNGGTFTMYGGTITGNSTQGNGGGVYVSYGGTFTMYGGAITGNTAIDSNDDEYRGNGGGVYLEESGSCFNMYGGRIRNNTATHHGGGVMVFDYDAFTVYGPVTITDNTVSGDRDNVCLYGSAIINIGGELGAADLGVSLWDRYIDYPITSGLDGKGTKTNFFADNPLWRVDSADYGEVLLYAPTFRAVTIQDPIVGGAVAANVATAARDDVVTLIVTPNAGLILAENGLTVTYDDNGTPTPVALTQGTGEDADKWTFTMPDADVTVSAAFSVPYVDVDGNSQVLTGEYTLVEEAGTWTDGWYVVSGSVTLGGTVIIDHDAHLILCDGATLTFSDQYQIKLDGSDRSLTIYGQNGGTGTIRGSGNQVILNKGTVTVSGGRITGEGMGTIANGEDLSKGNLIIRGGTVENTEGGFAIANANGSCTLAISGGTILGEIAAYYSDTCTVTGGTFSEDPSGFLSAGYHATRSGDNYVVAAHTWDDSGVCTGCAAHAVARLNGAAYYMSVDDALTYASGTATIELLADEELNGFYVTDGKALTLDLGSHTLTLTDATNSVWVDDGCSLTVTGTTGSLVASEIVVENGGLFVVTGGIFTYCPVTAANAGRVKLRGGYYATDPAAYLETGYLVRTLYDAGTGSDAVAYAAGAIYKVVAAAKVTFNLNGGTYNGSPDPVEVWVEKGTTAESLDPAPTKDDCDFGGWFTTDALSVAWDFGTDTVTGDVTLYAKWTTTPALYALADQVAITATGKFGLVFYVIVPTDLTEDMTATFTVDGASVAVEPTGSEIRSGGTRYRFVYYVPAPEDKKIVALKLYDKDGAIIPMYDENGTRLTDDAYASSIYRFNQLAQQSGPANLKAFMSSVYNYVEYARQYFGVDAATPCEGGELTTTAADLQPYAFTAPTGLPDGLHYAGMTLLMQSDTSLRLYFTVDDGHAIGDYAFKLGRTGTEGAAYQPREGTGSHAGQYYVEISNIPAAELGDTYTVQAGGVSFDVSALSYAYLALNSSRTSENLKNAAKALYEYCQAARTYFNK